MGEIEIASRLREVLARLDNDQADLWIEFVEACNDYRAVCDKPGKDTGAVATSLDAMKDAYRRWSAA